MRLPTKPRTGSRELTADERTELRKRHRRVQALRYKPGAKRTQARTSLLWLLVDLYDDGVPVTHLGAAMDVTGQRAQQLVAEGQALPQEATA